jgi:deoxyribonuclease V
MAVQKEMAKKVRVENDLPKPPRLIGGVDVSCNFRDPSQMIYAAAVIVDAKTLEVVERSTTRLRQTFPYIPGFLAFREAPAIVEALKGLKSLPDLLMVDGHGLCHPRGLGIASHLGVLCDLPVIGVGKTILVGDPTGPVGPNRGDQTPLIYKRKEVATLLRSRSGARPLIISVGHRLELTTAVGWVLQSLTGYRLPEPTRQAHLAANEERTTLQRMAI